jgi:signal transduction histidine kinase
MLAPLIWNLPMTDDPNREDGMLDNPEPCGNQSSATSTAHAQPTREAGRSEAGLGQDRVDRTGLLGVMATGIAHEFSNLLTIVLGSLEQLRRQPLDERGREQLDRAEWAVRQAGRLSRSVSSAAATVAGSSTSAAADC